MRFCTLVLLCATVALIGVAAARPAAATVPPTAAECLELGYEKGAVRCSACATLFLVTQSMELRQECESCCTGGDDENTGNDKDTYVSARIEGRGMTVALEQPDMNALAVFKRKYGAQPYFKHISFVDRPSAMFPRIVLVGSDPTDVVTMRISSWSAETLHEFCAKKIRVN